MAQRIYGTLTEVDPQATWLQMTWLFYFDSAHWTPERIRAYLRAVPQDRMLLLDYYAEDVELWRRTESFFGQPFLWCYLGNFGGNTMLAGNFHETSRRLEAALDAQSGNSLSGIGATLEAFGVNRFMYEFVLEKAWDTGLTDRAWVDALADSHAGQHNSLLRQAWQTLADSIYVEPARLGQGTLTNARPGLTGTGNWTTNPSVPYDNRLLCRVWGEMVEAGAGQAHRDAYVYDLVNVGRQVLGNHFRTLRDSLTAACRRGDAAGVMRRAAEMSALLDDLERLLSCHRSFLFGRWQQAAEDMGATPNERACFRRNARTLVTTWGERGQSLNDYANRSLAGLTADFYAARWRQLLREVTAGMAAGRPLDEKAFREGILDFEVDWALSGTAAGPLEPRGRLRSGAQPVAEVPSGHFGRRLTGRPPARPAASARRLRDVRTGLRGVFSSLSPVSAGLSPRAERCGVSFVPGKASPSHRARSSRGRSRWGKRRRTAALVRA